MLFTRRRTAARLYTRLPRERLRNGLVLLTALLAFAAAVGAYVVTFKGWSTDGVPLPGGDGPQALAERAAAEAAANRTERADALAAAAAAAEAGATLESRLITETAETARSTVALTFDDGPHPEWTPRVLEALRRHDVKAVFCVLGENVAAHPDLLREIVADGHRLCNHSFTHDFDLPSLERPEVSDELELTMEAIHDAVPGVDVPWYRAPGGFWGETVWDVAVDNGMQSLWWAIDPVDWERPGESVLFERVTEALHPGAVILLHDGGGDRSETSAALDRLIPAIRGQGYEFAMPATAIPDPVDM
jgi:peptidoglycan/xylan/chitin deacetylase (PgdA/CDA1 family)